MPDDLPAIMEQSRHKVADLLARFCDTPGSRNQGGFVNPATGWADTRNSIYEIHDLFAAYLYPEFGEHHGSPALLDKLRMHLDFMRRRQYPDGTIALDASGVGGGNEIGFTLVATTETFRRVQRSDLPGRDEILDKLAGYLQRGAAAVRHYFPYTSNHRWTACIGPLAAVDGLFPDPGNAAVIEEYLSDGIDINADGLYHEERSPNYNHVANWGLLYLADYWGRRDLLKLIESNLRLSLAMRQPSDEAETIYSHRQDRGGRGRTWGSYAMCKRMAIETGDGTFATAADHYLPHADEGCPWPLRYFFDDPRWSQENIRREPLPEDYELAMRESPLWRYRRGQVAATVVVDPGGHFWDITQGTWAGKQRADAFMSLHCGRAVIDAMKIRWGSGVGGFRPETIDYLPDGALSLRDRDPGWEHVAHYRPKEKWGSNHVEGLQEGEVTIAHEADGSAFQVQVRVGGVADIFLNVQFLLREDSRLQLPDGTIIALEKGGRTFTSAAGAYTLIGPDGSRIVIESLPASEHPLQIGDSRTLTGTAEQQCHRLILGLFAPVDLSIRFGLRPAAG